MSVMHHVNQTHVCIRSSSSSLSQKCFSASDVAQIGHFHNGLIHEWHSLVGPRQRLKRIWSVLCTCEEQVMHLSATPQSFLRAVLISLHRKQWLG